MRFIVGLKHKRKVSHVVADGEDALIAGLKVKAEHPEALIMYVRRQNRRGDARHPPLSDCPDAGGKARRDGQERGLSGGPATRDLPRPLGRTSPFSKPRP